MQKNEIKFEILNKSVQIHLPDDRVISGPRGTAVGDMLKPLGEEGSLPILGAIINGHLCELNQTIDIESAVIPVTMGMPDGMRIYRRSLTLLLEAAFEELFPEAEINIDHSVSFGGYFCQVKRVTPLLPKDVINLEKRMQELVSEDIPIIKKEIPLEEAIEYFAAKGYEDKVSLLKHRRKDYLVLYFLGEHRDYHQGYMVPSTSYLKWFKIESIEGGFTLRFPRRHKPNEIMPLGKYPKLLNTFRQYGDWLERLGIESVGSLNDAVEDGRIREVILVSEALHEQQIAEIASSIAARKKTRVVLIAGPSSSGKTTSPASPMHLTITPPPALIMSPAISK